MNEQAIIDSYNLFVESGYKKSLQEFKQLLASNPEAVNDSYGLFQQNGYKKSIDEYKTLMGIGATVESPMAVAEEPKKKGVMASPFVDGGLGPTKFDPGTGQVVQETPAFAQKQPEVKPQAPQQVTPEFKPLEGPFKPGEGIKYTEQDFDSKVQKQKVPTPQSYWNIFSKTIADLPSDVGESWAVASAFIERQLGKAGVPGADPNLTARDIHTYQLADDWRKYTDEVFPTNQEDKSTFLGGVVSGLGQVVPMVMSGGISNVSKAKAAMDIAKTALSTGTKLTPFINMGKDIAKQAASPTGLIGGSQVSSAMYRQAIDSGATEDQAQQYAIENFFVGTVAESLPMQSMFSRILKIEPTANILRILKEGAVGAAEEFTTEMWQTTYENWSAQRIYDFNREMLDGVGEAGAVGGAVGFILNTALAALVGKRARVKNEEEGKILDKSIEEVKSKINTVNKNNEDISTVAEELNSIEPIVLNYGDSKYFFARDKSGRMELAEEPMLEDQAKSMSNMLGKVYKGLEFSIEEVKSNDPYAPVKYNVIARERGAKQEVPTYKVDGKDVTVESIDELIKTKSKEELLAMNIEINNDQTGLTERLQAAVETKPADNQKRKERIVELNNLLASDAASLQDTGTGNLIPEARQEIQQELETLKTEEDAIQKQAAGQVPVQPRTGVSQEVAQGEPQAEPQVVTQEGQEEVAPTQQPDIEGEVSRLEQLFAEQETAPTKAAGVSILNDTDVEELRNRTQSKSQQATTQEEKNSADTKVKIIDTAKKAIKTLKSVFPDVDIVIHDDEGSYNAAMSELDAASGTRGNFFYETTADGKTTGRIDINLSRANSRTVAHEIGHGILLKTFGENTKLFNDFRTRLSKVLKADVSQALNNFADQYVDPTTGQLLEVGHEEFLVELTGMLEQQQADLSVTTMQKVAALINEFISKITGGKFKPFEDTKNTKDVVDFFNTISSSIREGSEIQKLNTQEPYSSGVAIPVSNPQEFVGKKFKSQLDIGDYKFPSNIDILRIANLPIKTLTELVRQYEGRVVIITSDATGYGVDRNGDPILGGFGFASNEKNVNDGIGFASVSTGTVKGTYTAAQKAYGTGKTLVLVMIQPPHTTINNSYGAKYIIRGLKEIAVSSKEELRKTKDAIKEFIKGSTSIQKELKKTDANQKRGSEKRLFDFIDSIDENTNLEEAVKEFLNDTTFTIRTVLGQGILFKNKDIRATKSTNYSKIALNNVGYNIYDFLKEYGDNTILTDDLILNNIGGYVVGGFELDVLPKEQRETLINDTQNKGIVHPLFNAKLPGTNHFRLDGLYGVQENFSEYAVPDTQISLSNEERDNLVREIYKDDNFYKASAREIPLEERSYTNLTVAAKTEFKNKYLKPQGLLIEAVPNVPTKVAKGEGFIPKEGAAEQIAKGEFVSKAEVTPKSKRVSKSQIIGENAELEGVVRHNLGVAKILSREGVSPERVKLFSMGWELGSDGKWRYEIPDGKFKENIDISRPSKLEDIFDAPDLFKAYPEARNIEVEFKLLPGNEFGNFDPSTKSIIINRSIYKNNRDAANLTMLHEIQHWIQVKELFQGGSSSVAAKFKMDKIVDYFEKLVKKRESIYDTARLFYADNQEVVKEAKDLLDFAKGQYDILKELTFEKGTKEEKVKAAEMIKNLSDYAKRGIVSAQNLIDELSKKNPADAFNLYYRVAGEVEARNVEYRNKLTPSQRRNILLSDTENIDREDQIMLDSFGFVFEANEMKDEFRVSRSQLDDQNRVNKLINDARSQGFSEEAIVLFLQRKGLTDNAIDTAMAKAEPAAKKVEVTEEFAPGYDRVLNNMFGKDGVVAKSRKRGVSKEDTIKNAINYLMGTKVYENATDVQREAMVRNVNKELEKREKAAPTTEKVVGKPKKKEVTVDEMAALKDQIKLEARAAREAKGDLNKKRKALADKVSALKGKGTVTTNQIDTIVRRIEKTNLDNPIMVDRLLTYIEKVFDNANYAADMAELRKLQRQAKSRNHTSMTNVVNQFTSINPETIPLDRIQDYKEALDFLNNRTPSYSNMNDVFDEMLSYQISEEFDAVKTMEALQKKYEDIMANEINTVEDYVNLIKDINSFKRKAFQLLQNEAITQKQYDDLIKMVGENQEAIEKTFAEEITKIKKDLIAEIKKQRPKVSRDFSKEENDLIRKYLELSDADLESLSPEDLFVLNDLLENISNGEIDNFRFNEIISKAYTSDGANRLAKQIDDSKFDMTPEEGTKELSEYESAFWEGLLGMGRAKSGALQKFVVSVFNRAIASYENLTRDGYNEFLKIKNKYKMSDKDMHKIGMLTTYLQEYMAQFDPNNEGIKDIGKRDWFKEILSSKSMRGKYSSGKPSILKVIGLGKSEIDIIEEIWDSLPKDKDGNVDPKAVYDSYMANDGKFFTKNEKGFFDDVMAYKTSEITPKQKFANEINGASFKEIPFHMMRVRLDGGKTQITPTASSDNGVVRIKAGTGKERVSEAVGPIMTNFEKLFITNLEQTGRDYFLSGALKDINNTLSGAKKKIDPDKIPLLDTISGTLSEALGYEFDRTRTEMILRSLLSARAATTLLNPIRTAMELGATLSSYPLRAKTLSGYKDLFGKQKEMSKLLEFTNSPLRLRQNINNAIDINDGRIEPQSRLTKATAYLSGLPERTMMVTSWMPTFRSEFKDITGLDFDMKKFNDSEAYREKYGKAVKEASAVADAQTEKIIGPTTKAGQRREVRIAPKVLANIIGLEGTVSKNTAAGQILGFFSNYPYREVTEFVNGFKEAAEVIKDEGALSSVSQLQKPLGIALNVAAYGFLGSLAYAAQNILLGDDDDEERGNKILKDLMTTEGFLNELASNAISLAGSKYAAGGKALLQLAATIAIESTDDEEQKAKIKKLLKDSVFVDPLPVEQATKFGGRDKALSAIGMYIPQFVILADRYADLIGGINEVGAIYDKVESKGVESLTQDEGTKILALNTIFNASQIVLNLAGTSIPAYNYIKTYMNKLKEDAGVAEVYKGEAPTKKKSSGGGGGRAKTMNKSDLKRYFPEQYNELYGEGSATYEIEQEVKAFEKEQRELKKKIKDQVYGD